MSSKLSRIGFIESEEVDPQTYKLKLGDSDYAFERCVTVMIKNLDLKSIDQIVSEAWIEVDGTRIDCSLSSFTFREKFIKSTTFNCNIPRPTIAKYPSKINLFVKTKIPVIICCCKEDISGEYFVKENAPLMLSPRTTTEKKCCCVLL